MSEDRLQTREAMLFELQAEKHNHRRDNEYLVGQVNKLTSENAELAADLRATMVREEKAHAEVERLRAALRWGIGAALNEMTVCNLPLEWSPESGIGKMLAALRINADRMTPEVERELSKVEPIAPRR